jgi:ribose transport system substrate-binding protein
MQNLMNRYRKTVDGLFCPNESTTFGALQVVVESGLAGQLTFVGFDSSPKLI